MSTTLLAYAFFALCGYFLLVSLAFVLAFLIGYAARVAYRGFKFGYDLAVRIAI